MLTTFFPAPCRLCGDPLTNLSRLPVCALCLGSMTPAMGALCAVCGERLPGEFSLRCELCARYQYPFFRAVAYAGYTGEARALIHLLKYDGVKSAAPKLGQMLAAAMRKLEEQLAESADPVLVVPVPLHRRKQRARGFNQSELVTRIAFSELKRDPARSKLEYAPGLLQRTRATEAQIWLSRHQRRSNLHHAFSVSRPDRVKGRRVLLTDDVFTTGSTLAECARTLKRAGAKEVWAATIARAFRFTAAELDRWRFNALGPTGSLENREALVEHPMG